MSGQEACQTCPTNTTALQLNSTACTHCPTGQWAADPAQQCGTWCGYVYAVVILLNSTVNMARPSALSASATYHSLLSAAAPRVLSTNSDWMGGRGYVATAQAQTVTCCPTTIAVLQPTTPSLFMNAPPAHISMVPCVWHARKTQRRRAGVPSFFPSDPGPRHRVWRAHTTPGRLRDLLSALSASLGIPRAARQRPGATTARLPSAGLALCLFIDHLETKIRL